MCIRDRRFGVQERGHVAEGQFADLILVNPDHHTDVMPEGLLSKCGWSSFEGVSFSHHIDATFVNGFQAWNGQQVAERAAGQRLRFATA